MFMKRLCQCVNHGFVFGVDIKSSRQESLLLKSGGYGFKQWRTADQVLFEVEQLAPLKVKVSSAALEKQCWIGSSRLLHCLA